MSQQLSSTKFTVKISLHNYDKQHKLKRPLQRAPDKQVVD